MPECINGAQFKELYRLKKRRSKVILAQIIRINGPLSQNSRIILNDMNARICIKYGITYLRELPADKVNDCKSFIKTYQYPFLGNLYG